MKYVSFLFSIALIGIAGSAFATEATPFSFNYNNHNAYYSCHYAESQAATVLKTLGAEVLSIECTGGIENNMMLPVSLEGGFILEAQGDRTVVFKGRESCDFNVKLIKTILATVEHTVVKENTSCWDAEGSYRFEIGLK